MTTHIATPPTQDWSPTIDHRNFGWRVKAVATTRIEGSWKAYIGAVPGAATDAQMAKEIKAVLHRGTSLPEGVARAMFTSAVFQALPYAN